MVIKNLFKNFGLAFPVEEQNYPGTHNGFTFNMESLAKDLIPCLALMSSLQLIKRNINRKREMDIGQRGKKKQVQAEIYVS